MKQRFFRIAMLGTVILSIFCGAPTRAQADDLTVYLQRDTSVKPTQPGYWAVRAQFNNPVFPSSLARSARVTVDGTETKFETRAPRTDEPATRPAREFLIVPTAAGPGPATVRITIAKGLSDATGRRLLAREYSYEFVSVERIKVSGFSTFYTSKKVKGVRVTIPDGILESELAAAIEISPTVPDLTVTRDIGLTYKIAGDFVFNRDYVLRVKPLAVRSGSAVLVAEEFSFKGPGLKSEVLPRTDRSVVERVGRQLFPLTLSNVSKVQCKLTRVPPYLIPEIAVALGTKDGLKARDLQKKTEELQGLAASGKVDKVFAGEAAEDSEVFFAPEARDHVFGYSLPLSFRSDPEKGGAWIVTLSDPDTEFSNTVPRVVCITDLALSYKLSAKSLLVWVTSIHSGDSVGGVDMLLFQSDGTRHFVGKTNKEGLLVVTDGKEYPWIKPSEKGPEAGKSPIALSAVTWTVAATRDDACGVAVDSLRLKPFAVTQTKQVKDQPDSIRGYVFTERGVYRPGETVHFKYVSRAFRGNSIAVPMAEKVQVQIISPRQDVHFSKEMALGEFGTCHDSMPTKTFFPVGTYTIQVKPKVADNRSESFSTTFMLQDFKPPRHFARLSIKPGKRDSKEYVGIKQQEDFLEVEVSGEYYTGGPVKHGRVRWTATLVPVVNQVQGLSGYFFGSEDEKTTFLESGESTLDSHGKLRFDLPLDRRLLTGIYGVKISVTVLDIDGEPATEVQTYNPKPKFLVGIAVHPSRVQTGYEAPLKVIVVDEQGRKVPSGTVEATVMERESFYVQKRDESGNINYLWEEGWMKRVSSTLPLANGEATFQTSLHDTGSYLIAFTFVQDSGRYTSQTRFMVGWQTYEEWLERRRDKEVLTSNEILLSMNKADYAVGESVDVQFHTPRPVKKVLVTLERGEIFDFKVLDTPKDGNYRFTVQEKFVPNVYVSVLAAAGRLGYPLYKSQADSDIPIVYYGYADVCVTSPAQRLQLELAPEKAELKARPAEKTSISIKVTDQNGNGVRSEAAIGVVDEAVLALTRFQTPSLSSLTKFDIPLSVFSGDLRLDLVTQDLFRILSTRPLTGGDGGGGEIAASLRKDFRPVAYFNPAVVTDENGQASVEFKLPDTTTAYRVYAVVCDRGSGFVSGQRTLVVTKEFFIEPSIPRFLIPGDQVRFPVVLNNKTKEKGTFALEAEASAALNIRLDEVSGAIEPWSSSVVKAWAEVTSGTENGKLLFKGKFTSDSERYSDAIELTFPILSVHLPAYRSQVGDFAQSTAVQAKLPDSLRSIDRGSLNPSDFQANLTLSTTDWSKITPGLKYLLRYPFGCVEQTSSGVIPLAGIRALVTAGIIPGISAQQVDEFLNGGVERLLSMQVGAGGFAYWPGEQHPSWWGTMYATFALTMAREAGFDVPEDRMRKALAYLRRNLFERDVDRFHGAQWTKELALFNLAMGKQLNAQELEPFFTDYDEMGFQSKALLLLAAKRTGYLSEKDLVSMVGKLDPAFDRKRTAYYNSSYREMAACLLAAMELRAAPKKAEQWAGFLQRGLNPEGRWVSTADTGWCLLALGTYYEAKEAKTPKKINVTIDYDGSDPTELTMTETTAYLQLDPFKLLEKGGITIRSDSKHLISYTLDLVYPDLATDPSQLSSGFTLRKRIENLNGKEEIRVGDVVRVTLEMDLRDPNKTYSDKNFEYLALVDPVPAGLVPVNSELKTEGVAEQKSADGDRLVGDSYHFTPTYQEFRDDGVRVFRNQAWNGLYKYTYLARAVAEGEFWMRGSRISLMYDPDYFGRTEGKRIKVLPAR